MPSLNDRKPEQQPPPCIPIASVSLAGGQESICQQPSSLPPGLTEQSFALECTPTTTQRETWAHGGERWVCTDLEIKSPTGVKAMGAFSRPRVLRAARLLLGTLGNLTVTDSIFL